MPLFLPSDPDLFPTGELKKVEKAPEPKPEPKDTWKEIKPGIFQNGLGQKRTGDMRTKLEQYTKVTVAGYQEGPKTRDIAPYTQTFWETHLKSCLKRWPKLIWHFH